MDTDISTSAANSRPRPAWLDRLTAHLARDLLSAELKDDAIVFSPHFDDETLGVGATLLTKAALGAATTLVFFTDGSKSHKQFMPEEDLRSVRKQEAVEAARRMGIDDGRVIFLDFEEGRLHLHVGEVAARVGTILRSRAAREIYVPHSAEPPQWSRDHITVTRAVYRALRDTGIRARIREYPIWLWYQWPFIPLAGLSRGEARRVLRNSIAGLFGLRVVFGLNRKLVVDPRLVSLKKAMLDGYRTQMTRFGDRAAWPTLGDVGGGKFLARFLGRYEFFRESWIDFRSVPAAVVSPGVQV